MRKFDESSGHRIDRDLTARLCSAYSIAVLVLFATFSPGPTKVTAPSPRPTLCC
jgi:hypothetical protein